MAFLAAGQDKTEEWSTKGKS
jgi:hypothetical protein